MATTDHSGTAEVAESTRRDKDDDQQECQDADAYGLDDLFTITDYQLITVRIPKGRHHYKQQSLSPPPPWKDPDDEGNDNYYWSIELLQSPAACTDPDLTGQVLWPVSRLLSYYLASSSTNNSSSSPSSSHLSRVHGKTVLELGAGGTALPSLTACYCGARTVIATDGNDGVVLDLLQQNISRHSNNNGLPANDTENNNNNKDNSSSSSSRLLPQQRQSNSTNNHLTCRQLMWGNRRHVQDLLYHFHDTPQDCCCSPNDNDDDDDDDKRISSKKNADAAETHHQHRLWVDIVVAADVVQWPAVVEPLLHTVKAVLWRPNDHSSEKNKAYETAQHPQPVFLLGLVPRSSNVTDLFFDTARDLGFAVRAIAPSEYLLPNNDNDNASCLVPPECREYGGRTTELYELTLRSNNNNCRDDFPVLLSPHMATNAGMLHSEQQQFDISNGKDYLVGTSFEHTTFLPC